MEDGKWKLLSYTSFNGQQGNQSNGCYEEADVSEKSKIICFEAWGLVYFFLGRAGITKFGYILLINKRGDGHNSELDC